jgi:hypothetical protein
LDSQRTIQEGAEADIIRATERQRLRALVDVDMDVAHMLHADDFELINPGGGVLSKEEYLGGITSGKINYVLFEPDSAIAVRLYGDAAVIRYRSLLEIVFEGRQSPRSHYWHTDSYERRDGRWQAVWSQATAI